MLKLGKLLPILANYYIVFREIIFFGKIGRKLYRIITRYTVIPCQYTQGCIINETHILTIIGINI